MKRRTTIGLIYAWLMAVMCFSCDRRPLVYPSQLDVGVKVYVDWSKSIVPQPSGMTTQLYAPSHLQWADASNETDSTYFSVKSGTKRLLLFNYTPSEFATFRFHALEDYFQAHVQLSQMSRRIPEQWGIGKKLTYQPEQLAVATDSFTIDDNLIEKTYGDNLCHLSHPALTLYATPHSLITSFYLKIRVKGLRSMKDVKGSISGMAGGCRLHNGQPLLPTVTHLLEDVSVEFDHQGSADGWIHYKLSCLGIPHDDRQIDSNTEGNNLLRLRFMLRDGKTQIDYSKKVGNSIEWIYKKTAAHDLCQGKEGYLYLLIDIDGPSLPDVEGGGEGEGGFDADVDDWEDGGEIDINV